MVDVFYTLFRPGVCAVLNGVHSHEYVTATGTLTREPRLKRGTCEGKVRPATTMATSERPRAMVLVKACCSTLTAFSHGEVPVWPKAGAARNRATKPVVKNRKRTADEWKRLQQDMFMGMPPPQMEKSTMYGSEGRPLASPGQVVGLRAMREPAVHATWPRSVSRHSWSFSPINSVVPRSRSPLPQAVRDAERRTGEPGVALLAGVRGENSSHYTKRPPERKNAKRKCR